VRYAKLQRTYLEDMCVVNLNTSSHSIVILVTDVRVGIEGTVKVRIRYRFQGHWAAHVGSMEWIG
jgi:hypothetical protein